MRAPHSEYYFDYAASTPVDRRVIEAMLPYASDSFGNPGSLHLYGQHALAALDASRASVADVFGVSFDQVVFTSGATEANNLALLGTVSFWKQANSTSTVIPRIIVSAIEHESVLAPARHLSEQGIVDLVIVPVDRTGRIDFDVFLGALTPQTIFISIMAGNNEVGTLQPIQRIGVTIREFRQNHTASYPLFHVDAAQAVAYMPFFLNELGIDLLTVSSQKIYGPKGVGVLCLGDFVFTRGLGRGSKTPRIAPLLFGGGQEFGLRSGTEPVSSIVGFSKAVLLANESRSSRSRSVSNIKQRFWNEVRTFAPHASINGTDKIHESLPHIINIYFPGHDATNMLLLFDLAHIAVSSGSACSARTFTLSPVLSALGYSRERIASSLRFSFGHTTTGREIFVLLRVLKKILASKK